jgi:phosphoribosylformylglycinamidine (FGAM) synthase-like enzyme
VSRDMVKVTQALAQVVERIRKSMNKPLRDFKNKGLSVAIWETRNGGYSYSISKRYKDKQSGEWRETKNLFKEEAEALIILLQEALAYDHSIAQHQAEGIPSGQNKPGPKVQYELTEQEIDDIPF